MRWRLGRYQPFVAAAIAGGFVLALTATYIDALRDEGVVPEVAAIWVGGILVALLFAFITFGFAALPGRDRRQAAMVANQLMLKEGQLKQVLDAAPVLFFGLDKEARIEFVEGAIVKTLLPQGTDVIGKSILDYAQPGDAWAEHIKTALGGKEVSALINAGGRNWDTQYRPRFDSDGNVDGMVGISTDVTERRETEEKERESWERTAEIEHLREMNLVKTQLLNTAAHELNTPMTPIRLQLHILASGSLGDLNNRQTRAVGILDRSVKRLGLLVDDILDVARVQSGKLAMEVKPLRLREAAAEVIDTFQETATQVGVRLELVDGADAWVKADANRISQVLTNFVSNSIKFTKDGGSVKVKIQQAGDKVKLAVVDTGYGLEDEQIARLFQPFSQVHDVNEVTARGTGLGLYICKGIIDGLDGEIGVESEGLGKGSSFYFELPASSPTTEGEAAPIAVPKREPILQETRPKTDTPMARRLRELI